MNRKDLFCKEDKCMLPEEIKRSLSLTTNQLKRNISPKDIHIESTDESLESTGLVGQARAEKVMRFGLNVNQKGYNIYVAGNSGVGKSSFTEAILAEFAEKEAQVHESANKYNLTIQKSQRGFVTAPMSNGKQITDKEYQTLDQATLKKFDEQSAKLQEEIYDDMKYIGQLEAELKQTLAKLDERVA